jgi:lipid A 4'-phosphatase
MTDPRRQQDDADKRARLELAATAAIAGVLAAIIFVGWPSLDLAVSRPFNLGPRHFWLTGSEFAGDLRSLFMLVTWAAGVAAVAGIVLAIATRRHLFGLGLPQWLFLVLVLALGPGIVANTVFKDNWARPRPSQIVELGGTQPFVPVLERSGQCNRNCSFVSGEASSIFALGFAIAMLVPRRRARLMGVAVLAGGVIGFIRISEGGHFLSDVVFAGVFMGLVVALLHWVVFGLLRGRLGDDAWWHDVAVTGAGRLRASWTRLLAAGTDWARRYCPRALAGIFAATPRDEQD